MPGMKRSVRGLSQCGFTMMELLVTMVLLAIVFAAMVPVFAGALKAASGDQMRVTAQSIAQQRMEQIRLMQFDQLSALSPSTVTAYTGSSGKVYTINPTVVFNPASATPTQAQNAEITLDVSWLDVYKVGGGSSAKKTMHLYLKTVISRQFAGPGIRNVTLGPVNALDQLIGSPTTITVYITPANAGANNANISSVKVTVSDSTNGSFTPVTLTASAVSAGVYAASWNQSGAAANDTFAFSAQATSTNQALGNPFVKKAKLITGQAPSPVANFAIARGNTRLLLTWDNSVATDFNHYELWRGTVSGSETLLVDNLKASGYIDTGLTNGTTYYYKVRVVDNDGNTSTWVSASGSPAAQTDVTPPGTPGSFTATRSSNNAMLSFTVPADTGSGVAGYYIYRDGAPYIRWAPGGVAGATLQYTDPIGYTVAHTYSVVAFDGVGLVSAPTATLTVGTATPPVFNLTVTVNKATPAVTVTVVYNDAQPDPLNCGTKSATSSSSASWPGLSYGAYTITATWNGTTIAQDISLIAPMSVSITF
jgi:prepilin-type N-terminal cleavage/methylation domain-containing protein